MPEGSSTAATAARRGVSGHAAAGRDASAAAAPAREVLFREAALEASAPGVSGSEARHDELLRVRNLSCGYGRRRVLEGLDFSLWSGFFCGLLGPNGSGKSTLINNLCRVYEPLGGSIELAGRDIRGYDRAALARQVAVVPQDTHVSFPFSVREVVAMGRNPHLRGLFSKGYKEDDPVVDRVLEELGIAHLAPAVITRISGGERQLVLLARALVQEPRLLLLDEPTSNLDIRHAVRILRLVEERVRTGGLAVLAIFHDLNLASVFADYLFMLKDGGIACQGETREVIRREVLREVFGTELLVYTPDELGWPQVAVPPAGFC
ncbi:MAG: ABC transporter ATP-binding protein [Deltaproteobacteria bacterium]|nr:ABC transporter ATP-binding protein [Candidatus Anaeroferrophillacea bacterium]